MESASLASAAMHYPPAALDVPFPSSRRIGSSLTLQQLLYYNWYWSVAWFIAFCSRLVLKYGEGLTLQDPDIVRTVLLVFWLLAEPLRLAAGYYGNLQENVPVLVLFGVLCLAPQTAVAYYLMLAAYDRTALDIALQVVMVLFLHVQFAVSLGVIVSMFRSQQQQYKHYEEAVRHQRQQQIEQRYSQSRALRSTQRTALSALAPTGGGLGQAALQSRRATPGPPAAHQPLLPAGATSGIGSNGGSSGGFVR